MKEQSTIKDQMKASTNKFYSWATQKANSSKSPLWIGLLFFLELFLFIPLDAVLIFFCLQNQKKTFLYVSIAAIASTISGMVGYLLGHFLWDVIGSYVVPTLISASLFDRMSGHFQLYENWAVFFGSLLPFPLKALSISAGVFHLGLTPFLGYLLMARFLRFAIVGSAMLIWGEQLKNFIERHFRWLMFLLGAKITLALIFIYILAQ
jgi:membrane protein YqaA with SNARE-associated domain